MRVRCLFILVAVFGVALAQDEEEIDCKETFLCTDDFCGSICAPTDCHIPEGEDCLGILLPLFDNSGDYCGCCPWRCVTYLAEGEQCTHNLKAPYPSEICGAQLACSVDSVCVRASTPCLDALTEYEQLLAAGDLGMNMSPPLCDEHGYYEPVQCERGGFCHCVDKNSGEYIFGVSGSQTESDEQGQRCDCARNYHEGLLQGCRMTTKYIGDLAQYEADYQECVEKAKKASAVDNVFFPGYMRCVANGNYDVIQCVTDYTTEEDRCFCVDDQISVNGTITYMTLITDLKCFDPDVHNYNYFQPCEMEAVLMGKVGNLKAEDDDRLFYSGGWMPNCTPDGYYAKVQNDKTDYKRLYCVDRDGVPVEDYEDKMGSATAAAMNCECAFARRYIGEGQTKPICEANGNFRVEQCRNGECYCVDEYGRQCNKEVDQFEFEGCQGCPQTEL